MGKDPEAKVIRQVKEEGVNTLTSFTPQAPVGEFGSHYGCWAFTPKVELSLLSILVSAVESGVKSGVCPVPFDSQA